MNKGRVRDGVEGTKHVVKGLSEQRHQLPPRLHHLLVKILPRLVTLQSPSAPEGKREESEGGKERRGDGEREDEDEGRAYRCNSFKASIVETKSSIQQVEVVDEGRIRLLCCAC